MPGDYGILTGAEDEDGQPDEPQRAGWLRLAAHAVPRSSRMRLVPEPVAAASYLNQVLDRDVRRVEQLIVTGYDARGSSL